MHALVKVLGGVLVLGGVTATDVAASEAQPKVDPGISHFQTLFATIAAGSDLADGFQVGTSCGQADTSQFVFRPGVRRVGQALLS
jgi:hypothetical protein